MHRLSKTRLYKIYGGIKQRCYNENNPRYLRYGGRGISICDEWIGKNGFINFYNWSIQNNYSDNFNNNSEEMLCLDRIDNNGNYSPTNCRFISRSENSKKAQQDGGKEACRLGYWNYIQKLAKV